MIRIAGIHWDRYGQNLMTAANRYHRVPVRHAGVRLEDREAMALRNVRAARRAPQLARRGLGDEDSEDEYMDEPVVEPRAPEIETSLPVEIAPVEETSAGESFVDLINSFMGRRGTPS